MAFSRLVSTCTIPDMMTFFPRDKSWRHFRIPVMSWQKSSGVGPRFWYSFSVQTLAKACMVLAALNRWTVSESMAAS